MKKCPICSTPIPTTKTYCSRKCSAKAWKSLQPPIIWSETRIRLEKRRLSR